MSGGSDAGACGVGDVLCEWVFVVGFVFVVGVVDGGLVLVAGVSGVVYGLVCEAYCVAFGCDDECVGCGCVDDDGE